MADIVNFNDRRKKKARQEKEAAAAANRLLFGRTKGEKERETKERSAEIRKLDGAQRKRNGEDDESER